MPVSCAEFFGHYARMLAMAPPRTVPTAVAIALASAAATYERARGRSTELNAETVRYLTRTGGYSRAKAQRLLDWLPQISLEQDMARTEAWLRDEGLLNRS